MHRDVRSMSIHVFMNKYERNNLALKEKGKKYYPSISSEKFNFPKTNIFFLLLILKDHYCLGLNLCL